MRMQTRTLIKVLEMMLPEIKVFVKRHPLLLLHPRVNRGHEHRQNKVKENFQEYSGQH